MSILSHFINENENTAIYKSFKGTNPENIQAGITHILINPDFISYQIYKPPKLNDVETAQEIIDLERYIRNTGITDEFLVKSLSRARYSKRIINHPTKKDIEKIQRKILKKKNIIDSKLNRNETYC